MSSSVDGGDDADFGCSFGEFDEDGLWTIIVGGGCATGDSW